MDTFQDGLSAVTDGVTAMTDFTEAVSGAMPSVGGEPLNPNGAWLKTAYYNLIVTHAYTMTASGGAHVQIPAAGQEGHQPHGQAPTPPESDPSDNIYGVNISYTLCKLGGGGEDGSPS